MTESTFVQIQTRCETARNRCGQLRRQVGSAVSRARRGQGWSRGALGRQLGIGSDRGLSRFGARLAAVERGETVPTAEELTHWQRVLPLDVTQLSSDLDDLRRQAERLSEWETKRRTFWMEQLAEDLQAGVARTAEWKREPVPGSGFFLFAGPLKFGHGPLTRGQLFALWQHPQGCASCPDCQGRLGLVFGARSLSRIHRLSGLCLDGDCGVIPEVTDVSVGSAKERFAWILDHLGSGGTQRGG